MWLYRVLGFRVWGYIGIIGKENGNYHMYVMQEEERPTLCSVPGLTFCTT